MGPSGAITVRSRIQPGDIGAIVSMHGLLYAREHGFDHTFEAYVAGPLAEFACRTSPRERIWIAERAGAPVGCIAIVEVDAAVAQLRWYLVVPEARGCGLGTTLLHEAVTFCREQGYRSIILWTVSALEAAARLYRAAGFRLVESQPGRHWGVDVVEEKYELSLG
ncbi:MAG: GNAT family N-acetyltransferase [Acidobacteria bacterium]|nr:GNAT family N-acetyltransferase [Acidobacteriota bacterium]